MELQELAALDKAHLMNTFGERLPVAFTHGKGCTLYDTDGKAYVDFLAGIATNALGYAHERFNAAITAQLNKFTHLSNYFYSEPQALAAAALVRHSFADKVFFASTGAEANECAIKLARRFFSKQGVGRYEIITAVNSFHGRTLATVTATGQPVYQVGFAPLPAGFSYVPFNDLAALQAAVGEHTAAVLLEPIQGEGGVIPATEEYLAGVRALCDKTGILLIFDEVQCGMGRTGKLFAHEHYGVAPDIMTLAKALGNGIPASACLCTDRVNAFSPGEHGTTFGGNPLACAAVCAVMEEMTAPGFLAAVAETGAYAKHALEALATEFPHTMLQVRGKGLLLGVELCAALPTAKLKLALLRCGFIVGTANQNVLRLVPPLIISKEEIDALSATLHDILTNKECE